MTEILKIVGIIVIQCLIFIMMGTIINKVLRIKRSGAITIIVGFFSWYALQEIIYVPLLILQADIKILVWEHVAAFIALVIVYVIGFRMKFISMVRNIVKECREALVVPVVFLVVMVIIAIIMIGTRKGFDTTYAHTISSVEMANLTGKMYMYDSDTGKLLDAPVYMEALGVWNMSIAVWGSIFHVNIMKLVKYGMGVMCLTLGLLIEIRIGKQLFKGDSKKAFTFAGICVLVKLIFCTGATQGAQLFVYGGTAKAYCANVLMPFILYWCICNKGKYKSAFDRKIIPIIILGSLALSLSTAVISVLLISIVIISDIIVNKYNKYKGVEKKNANVA